jgi:integrase
MKISLKYVDAIPTGRRIYYFFRKKGKRYPLSGVPGTREFQERYDELLAEHAPQVRAKLRRGEGGDFGTLAWFIVKYTDTDNPAWMRIKDSSKMVYRKSFEWLRQNYGDILLSAFDKAAIKQIRNELKATPVKANDVMDRFGQVWRWADEFLNLTGIYKLPDVCPTTGVRHIEHTATARQAWPQELCDKFEAMTDPEWSAVYMLLRYTGQRAGDCAKMRWADFNEARGEILVVQQKTGKKIAVPCHQRLRGFLATLPRKTNTILASKRGGRQMHADAITRIIGKLTTRFGFAGYSPHGLRHLAGCELAEAGCTARQVAAVLGHSNDRQAQHYMAQADERRLARSAMAKWESLDAIGHDNVVPLRGAAKG